MKVSIECLYCGYKVTRTIYNKSFLDEMKCEVCKDSSLKIRDFSKDCIDTYIKCPSFPASSVPVTSDTDDDRYDTYI